MAVNSRFRTLAFALRNYVENTYDLLCAVDAVMDLDSEVVDERPLSSLDIPRDLLVAAALGSPAVMTEVYAGKKINAIKALRTLGARPGSAPTTVGLKAAKEAVEDERVWGLYVDMLNDPWNQHSHDEPPF